MNEPPILYLIEHVSRELDVACIVKHVLERDHGLQLEIAHTTLDLERTLATRRPRVVVVPYFYVLRPHRRLLTAYRDRDVAYVNLNWEQLFHELSKVYRAPQDEFSRRHVMHAVWGEPFAEYLRGHGVPQEHIVVTGNPAFSLYGDPYKDYYLDRSALAREHGLDPDKPWLFVPDQYYSAFLTRSQIDNMVTSRGHTPAQAEERYQFELNSFRQVAHWWKAAAADGTLEVVLRPRPATPEGLFNHCLDREIGERPPNLHIIKRGTVREWILASECVASSFSTTLVEAAVARRSVAIHAPLPFPGFLKSDWQHLVPHAATQSEFLDLVRGGGDPASWGPLRAWTAQTTRLDGDPFEGIASLLASLQRGQLQAPSTRGVFQPALDEPDSSQPDPGLRERVGRLGERVVKRIPGLRRAVEARGGPSEPPFVHPFGLDEADMRRWSSQESELEMDEVDDTLVRDKTAEWAGRLSNPAG